MPTKTLDGKDAVLVSLAMQKEATLKQQAAQAFASDVALVVKDLGATGAVSFKIDGGQVTAEWPDKKPNGPTPLDLELESQRVDAMRELQARQALENAFPALVCKQCQNPLLKGLHTCGKKG